MIAWDLTWQSNILLGILIVVCLIWLVRHLIQSIGDKHWCEFPGCDDEANVLDNRHGWLCSLHFHEISDAEGKR